MMTQAKHKPRFKDEFKALFASHLIWFFIGVVIVGSTFVQQYTNNRMKNNEFNMSTLKSDVNTDQYTMELLFSVLIKSDAARVRLFRFHNSGMFSGSVPFKKYSNIQEVTQPGVSKELLNCQNIPIAAVPVFIGLMLNSNDSIVIHTDDLEYSAFRGLLERQAIKVMVTRPLLDLDRKLVWGFITVSYIDPPSEEIIEIAKKQLNSASLIIESVVGTYK